jgi:transketolase
MTTTSQITTATELDRLRVDTIRMLSIDAVQQANSGHPGTPTALSPIGYLLFTRAMTPGHPERGLAPGIETTTCPLGQGVATCFGLALGERMLNARLGDDYRESHPPELILIATGSEVRICARAADLLEAEGIATRVVSMECIENFAAHQQSYRDRVLPPGVKARVSLEAASTGDWHRWVGDVRKAIGMKGFGGSGPAGALYEHFGLTPERVALAGRRSLRRWREKAQVG